MVLPGRGCSERGSPRWFVLGFGSPRLLCSMCVYVKLSVYCLAWFHCLPCVPISAICISVGIGVMSIRSISVCVYSTMSVSMSMCVL